MLASVRRGSDRVRVEPLPLIGRILRDPVFSTRMDTQQELTSARIVQQLVQGIEGDLERGFRDQWPVGCVAVSLIDQLDRMLLQ